MNSVFQHWASDPVEYIVVGVAIVHLRGMRARLRSIRRANRPTTPWIQQAVLFYGGLLVLVVAVTSPIDYWSDSYLSAHIIQHVLLAFFAPPLIVLGAPWLPLLRGMPKPVRRALGRLMQLTKPDSSQSHAGRTRALAAARRLAARPVTSVALFNASMVLWHFPQPFDLAQRNQFVHIWLEHSSFFVFGVALWLQVFGSYPLRPVLDGPRRIVVLVATNGVMVLIAMTLVMFTHAIYPWYAESHTLAERVTDQQIGGSILWVCGEISFLPAILYTVMRWLDDGPSRDPTPKAGSARGDRPLTVSAP